MKVLFVTHQRAFQLYGGAETALSMWKARLRNRGVVCNLYSMYEDAFGGYDIVYLHNIAAFPVEAREILELAKSAGTKVVVSPIFWSSLESNLECAVGARKVAHFVQWLVSAFVSKTGIDFGLRSSLRSMKLALEKSEAIVVNSRAEADFITRYFSLRKPNIHIVYNGVDFRFESAAPELFVNTYGFSDFLLYVGRIEPRKNILRLLKAFNKAALNTEMIIIGKSVEGPLGAYWRECLKEAAKNRDRIHFLGPLEHSSPLLGSAYAASKTLVLPSFFETPGLSALEGAVAGANVVITKRGATREYFSDFAVYVDPSSVKSIAKGIYKGYHSPRNKNLKRHILENFTWDKSTDQLERAFKSVI